MSDVTLLRRIAEGDQEALRELHARHAPWLTHRLSRRCGDAGAVDEVVQDTFTAIWRKPSYRGTGEVAAWIWGIGVRRLIDRLRTEGRSLRTYAADRSNALLSAEDAWLVEIEQGSAGAALNRLSPELRAVLQATVLDGLTAREAAALLGIPVGTVKTRAMRARSRLRAELA
ncbi:MAG TPA: RNA polymerase sigma factor [Actinomycetota bacterium]|nr:RNA polymerase sigma factor [Actinomycetota bacterium]